MASSASSLASRGLISGKQMAKLQQLRGTKAQKAKMTVFEDKDKDEGNSKGQERFHSKQINDDSSQDRNMMSKGGNGVREGQVKRRQINDPSMQAKKFPQGGKASGKPGKTPSAIKATIPQQGGMYGGGGKNTQ